LGQIDRVTNPGKPVKVEKSRMLFLSGDTVDVDIEHGVYSPSPEPKTPV